MTNVNRDNFSTVRDSRRGTIGSQALGSTGSAKRATMKAVGQETFADGEASSSLARTAPARQSEIGTKFMLLEENEDVDLLPHSRYTQAGRTQSNVREIPLWNTIRRLNLR